MSKVNKSLNRDCVTALLIILLSVSPIASGAEPASAPGEQKILTAAQKRLQERVTFTCRNLPIDTVLMQLAEQADIDIIKSPNVRGDVTVKITDVPLDEALNNILAAHKWTYIASENIIRVMPLAEVSVVSGKLLTNIYHITYADVEQVAKALKEFVSAQGKIAINKGTNHIIITDIETKIEAVDRFIAQIDRETPQVLVEARIYDITTSEAFDIGVEWAVGRHTPLTTVTHKTEDVRADEHESRTDTYERITDENLLYEVATDGAGDPILYPDGSPVWVLDTSQEEELTERTEKAADTKRTEAPETVGWEIDEKDTVTTEDKSWWTDSQGKFLPVRKSKPYWGAKFTQEGGGVLRFGLLNDMIDLEIALSMLHSQTDAKLLANPRVLVLDNETATFKIVREIPYTDQTATTGATMAQTRFKDVGVQLQVTPHIARVGMIRLHIVPEFSVAEKQERNPITGELEVPSVNTRKVDTRALVKDGRTVVMGGLRKQETTKGIDKMPLLGDIPLLGNLFRYETETEITSEVVVFITPRIITEAVLSETEVRQLETIRFPSPPVSKASTEGDFTPEL